MSVCKFRYIIRYSVSLQEIISPKILAVVNLQPMRNKQFSKSYNYQHYSNEKLQVTDKKNIWSNNSEVSIIEKDDREKSVHIPPSEKAYLKSLSLSKKIKNAPNFEACNIIYKYNKNEFTYLHFRNLFEHLIHLNKLGYSYQNLSNSEEMANICYDLWKIINQYESYQLIRLLHLLHQLNIDGNSTIIRSILMVLKFKINDLTAEEISRFHGVLMNISSSKIRDALLIALPKVLTILLRERKPFQNNTPIASFAYLIEMCLEGSSHGLAIILRHIYHHTLPKLILEEKLTKRARELSLLLGTLLKIPVVDHDMEKLGIEFHKDILDILVHNCYAELMASGVKYLESDKAVMLIRQLLNAYRTGNEITWIVPFLLSISKVAIDFNWPLKDVFNLVYLQSKMHFVSNDLVNYVLETVPHASNEDLDQLQILPFLSPLSASSVDCNLKNSFLERFTTQPILKEIEQHSNIPWQSLLEILSMDFISRKLLDHVLNINVLNTCYENNVNKIRDEYSALLLHRTLKMLDLDYEVPTKFFENIQKMKLVSKLHFKEIIQEILGGPQFLVPNFDVNGIEIDYLCIHDKDGQPVCISNDSEHSFKNIDEFDGSYKKIAILEVPSSQTLRPGGQFNGKFKLKMRILEKDGYSVVPLPLQVMFGLEQQEVLRYIELKIFSQKMAHFPSTLYL